MATQDQNNLQRLRKAQEQLRMVDHGQAGTAIVLQLVNSSTNAREHDKVVLTAISASVEARLLKANVDDPDITKWVMAAVLASYELGKTDLFKPKKVRAA